MKSCEILRALFQQVYKWLVVIDDFTARFKMLHYERTIAWMKMNIFNRTVQFEKGLKCYVIKNG